MRATFYPKTIWITKFSAVWTSRKACLTKSWSRLTTLPTSKLTMCRTLIWMYQNCVEWSLPLKTFASIFGINSQNSCQILQYFTRYVHYGEHTRLLDDWHFLCRCASMKLKRTAVFTEANTVKSW
jgi:hypothetical protein